MPHVATIGTVTGTSSVSTLSVTLTAGALSGHTVIGAVAWESSAGTVPTISSVTDSRGNTWTTTPDVAAGGNSNVTAAVVLIRARITTALQVGDTVTVTISGGTRSRWAIQLDDFNDVNSGTPKDVTQHADNPTPSASLSTGATAATAQNYELAVAAFAYGGTHAAPTVPSGWSGASQLTAGTSTIRNLMVIWKYTSSTGAQTGTLTIDSSAAYCGVVAAYKATNPSPPVGRVSQAKFSVPQPTAPPVGRVAQVSLQVPVGVIGAVRVAQVKMRAPTVAGQAAYSGLKFADESGSLADAAIYSAQNGAV
jgi:hypothetical protein